MRANQEVASASGASSKDVAAVVDSSTVVKIDEDNSPTKGSSGQESTEKSTSTTLTPPTERQGGEWGRTESSWASSQSVDNYNIFSRTLLLYMIPLLKRGWRQVAVGLEREDLLGLPARLKIDENQGRLARSWGNEVRRSARKSQAPKLWRALYYANTAMLFSGTCLSIIQGLLSAVGRPLVLRALVKGVQRGDMSTGESVGLIFLFAIVSFAEGWIGVLGRQRLAENFATAFSQGISALVFDKMKRIEDAALLNGADAPQAASTFRSRRAMQRAAAKAVKAKSDKVKSAETALIGNDLARSYENLRSGSSLPMAMASVIGGIVVLLLTVGVSSLVGLAVMGAILLANIWISRISFRLEKINMANADERLSMVSAIVNSARAVKLFGWEDKFLDRINAVRTKEMKGIRLYRIAHVTNIIMGRASPVLSSMVTLVVYAVGAGGSLNISDAFVTVSVFQALRLGLIMMPLATQSLMAVSVSLERVQRYLTSPDAKDVERFPSSSSSSSPHEAGNKVLSLTNVNLSWPKESSSDPDQLTGVNLQLERGQVCAVVGRVASGKTTLVRGALQLLGASQGSCVITESTAYVPQRALVIGGTIRDNLLLGRPYDPERFQEALNLSQLQKDLELLPGLEHAEVGERGTTLSGGQAQRLSIARALYGRPDLLVMDDPLSAVDPKVCRAIFESAVRAAPWRPAVLIALNQLSYLPSCDRVVFLKDGRVDGFGTYEDLFRDHASFREFVRTYIEDEEEVVADDPLSPTSQGEAKRKSLMQSLQLGPTALPAAAEKPDSPKAVDALPVEEAAKDASPPSHPNLERATSILMVEKRTSGAVGGAVYCRYIAAFGYWFALASALFMAAGYGVMTYDDFWLSQWATAETERAAGQEVPHSTDYYVTVYACLSVGFALLLMLTSYSIVYGGVRASSTIHSDMIRNVVFAPMSWYESNPTGRVMSRFAGDLSRVDQYLSLTIDNATQLSAQFLATLIVVCVVVSVYLIPVVFVALVSFGMLLVIIDRTLRETKRLANAAMSPLLSNVAEARSGERETARAFGTRDYGYIDAFFSHRHRIAADEYARANFMSGTLVNFSYLAANFLSFFIAVAAACVLVVGKGYNPEYLGIALTYALVLPYMSSMTAQNLTQMNMTFTSLERVLEYGDLPQEPEHNLPTDPPVEEWPKSGRIEFRAITSRYRPGLPLVLKKCSFVIRGGESVGVVGRTGAGKSSLVACLFRLVDPVSGSVLIDDRDTRTIGLSCIRQRLTIIPQEVLLMQGTIRYNLDPFGEHNDADLFEALERVELHTRVELDDTVAAQGSNLSAGERQLLSFARALLLKNRIIIMDEPSSSLDLATDEVIGRLVSDEFRRRRKCTLLTIAHRVETIVSCDRVLVMKDGTVAEFDKPRALLERQGSDFKGMVDSLGAQASSRILTMAKKSALASEFPSP